MHTECSDIAWVPATVGRREAGGTAAKSSFADSLEPAAGSLEQGVGSLEQVVGSLEAAGIGRQKSDKALQRAAEKTLGRD